MTFKLVVVIANCQATSKMIYYMLQIFCILIAVGAGCLDFFFSPLSHMFLLSPSLWETARYRLKYCLKGPFSPKQPTNQRYSGLMDEYEINNETLISNPRNTERLSQFTYTLYETNSIFLTIPYMYMLCLNLSFFVLLYHAIYNYTMPFRQ